VEVTEIYINGFLAKIVRSTTTHFQVRFGNGKIATYPKTYVGLTYVDTGVEIVECSCAPSKVNERSYHRPSNWLGKKEYEDEYLPTFPKIF
jgi:hypothetical protein